MALEARDLYNNDQRAAILDKQSIVLDKIEWLQGKLVGTIKVKNFHYEKKVLARILNDGKQWRDIPATWSRNLPEENCDAFQFSLNWTEPSEERKFELVVCCEQAGQTFWDNNDNKNYSIIHRPKVKDAEGKPVEAKTEKAATVADTEPAKSSSKAKVAPQEPESSNAQAESVSRPEKQSSVKTSSDEKDSKENSSPSEHEINDRRNSKDETDKKVEEPTGENKPSNTPPEGSASTTSQEKPQTSSQASDDVIDGESPQEENNNTAEQNGGGKQKKQKASFKKKVLLVFGFLKNKNKRKADQ